MSSLDSPYQHTLRKPVSFVGIGLHSDQPVTLTLKPAAANTGVRFHRSDVAELQSEVIPRWQHVAESRLCTRIVNQHGVGVSTIEHLLAALRCCGVDNALAELNADEVPIMDGSAAPFVDLIRKVGTQRQNGHRWVISIQHPVAYREGDRFVSMLPDVASRISVEIDFPSYCIGRQICSARVDERFISRIAPARTFGFVDQLAALRGHGLARGGNLRNAILVDGERVINPEALRFPDECVRHKALDVLGDLALAGAPIRGHLYAYKPGHSLIQAFIKKLFAYPSSWRYMPLAELDKQLARGDNPEVGACRGEHQRPSCAG